MYIPPPTLANNAILSAPKLKPVNISMVRSISWLSTAASGAKIIFKIINRAPKPSTAKPATPMPITLPPVKDTFKAFDKLVLAASAVRTFALVATFMPINPANALKNAPNIKATAILQWLFSLV